MMSEKTPDTGEDPLFTPEEERTLTGMEQGARLKYEKLLTTTERPLLDAQGKTIGTIRLSYAQDKTSRTDVPGRFSITKQRALTSLVLAGPDGKEADMFAVAPVLKRKPLIVYSTREKYCRNRKEAIFANDPESLLDIAVLLHEAGHSEQEKDPLWSARMEYYLSESQWGMLNAKNPPKLNHLTLKELLEMYPDLRETLAKDPDAARFCDMQERIRILNESEPPDGNWKPILEEADALRRASDAIFATNTVLRAAAFRPILAIEWNANDRAEAWLRITQEQTGIDTLGTETLNDHNEAITPARHLENGVRSFYGPREALSG